MAKFKLLYENETDGWKKIYGNIYLNVKGIVEHLKYDEFLLDVTTQTLREITKNKVNKPTESDIKRAIIWYREVAHGELTYKAGGGSVSDKAYESQLVIETIASNGNDKKLIVLKGTKSRDIKDVYIHNVNVDDIEKIIKNSVPKKISWGILKNSILTYINACEKSITSGMKYEGKNIKFKNIDEFFKFIDFKNNDDLFPAITQNKNKVIGYLKELMSFLEKNWKMFDNPNLRKEIIEYFMKNI